jgi:hypothetical protein
MQFGGAAFPHAGMVAGGERSMDTDRPIALRQMPNQRMKLMPSGHSAEDIGRWSANVQTPIVQLVAFVAMQQCRRGRTR